MLTYKQFKSSDLYTFISQFKVLSGEDYTHVCMRGGIYNVPKTDLSELYRLIAVNTAPFALVECAHEYAILMIDLDIVVSKEQNNMGEVKDDLTGVARVDHDDFESLVERCCRIIFTLLKKNGRCFVTHCYNTGAGKFGYHLLFPRIVVTEKERWFFRSEILKGLKDHKMFIDDEHYIALDNTWEEIYDVSITKVPKRKFCGADKYIKSQKHPGSSKVTVPANRKHIWYGACNITYENKEECKWDRYYKKEPPVNIHIYVLKETSLLYAPRSRSFVAPKLFTVNNIKGHKNVFRMELKKALRRNCTPARVKHIKYLILSNFGLYGDIIGNINLYFGGFYKIELRTNLCPFIKMEHKSNHGYIWISKFRIARCCYDNNCKKTIKHNISLQSKKFLFGNNSVLK